MRCILQCLNRFLVPLQDRTRYGLHQMSSVLTRTGRSKEAHGAARALGSLNSVRHLRPEQDLRESCIGVRRRNSYRGVLVSPRLLSATAKSVEAKTPKLVSSHILRRIAQSFQILVPSPGHPMRPAAILSPCRVTAFSHRVAVY